MLCPCPDTPAVACALGSQDELMSMVKFGANQIFRTKDATVSDSDIDKILEHVRI